MTTMEWVKLAVSKDETRFALTSVWYENERASATDGHRLHVAPAPGEKTRRSEPPITGDPPPVDQVIPRKGREPCSYLARELRAKIHEAIKTAAQEARAEREEAKRAGRKPALVPPVVGLPRSDPRVHVNAHYLDDAIRGCTPAELVEITIQSEYDPIRVDRVDGRCAVIMPVVP